MGAANCSEASTAAQNSVRPLRQRAILMPQKSSGVARVKRLCESTGKRVESCLVDSVAPFSRPLRSSYHGDMQKGATCLKVWRVIVDSKCLWTA
jgi:hypothetical protein